MNLKLGNQRKSPSSVRVPFNCVFEEIVCSPPFLFDRTGVRTVPGGKVRVSPAPQRKQSVDFDRFKCMPHQPK